MKKMTRSTRKNMRAVNIEPMYESEDKILIRTSQITAVSAKNNLQNYEDYINDKYLTGAIVRRLFRKRSKKQEST